MKTRYLHSFSSKIYFKQMKCRHPKETRNGHLFGIEKDRRHVFLKNSIRSESQSGVRRTFDHNLWEL